MTPLLLRFWKPLAVVALILALITGARLYIGHVDRTARAEQAAADEAAVKLAMAEAKAADTARARAVEAQQDKVTSDVSTDYQRQLVALRARYDGLLASSKADRGGGRTADMPSFPDAASGLDVCASADGLFGLARDADENTIKLVALQAWVAGQAKVER